MRKELFLFMRNSFLASLPFVLLSVLCGLFPMSYLDDESAWWKQQKDYILNSSEYNRVIILGDSRAKAAFQPAFLSEDTYNIALGGATSIEMYYTLKNYLKNHPAPQMLILSFGAYHYQILECFWSRTTYFHYLGIIEYIETIKNAIYYNNQTIICDGYLFEALSYGLYLPNKYAAAIRSSFLAVSSETQTRKEINGQRYLEAASGRGHILFGKGDYSEDLAVEANGSFGTDALLDYYLMEILNLCFQNNIQIVIESVPFNKATYDSLSDKFIEDYANYMNLLKERRPEIIVNVDVTYLSNDYFGDPSHLNRIGSYVYSEMVRKKYPVYFN